MTYVRAASVVSVQSSPDLAMAMHRCSSASCVRRLDRHDWPLWQRTLPVGISDVSPVIPANPA